LITISSPKSPAASLISKAIPVIWSTSIIGNEGRHEKSLHHRWLGQSGCRREIHPSFSAPSPVSQRVLPHHAMSQLYLFGRPQTMAGPRRTHLRRGLSNHLRILESVLHCQWPNALGPVHVGSRGINGINGLTSIRYRSSRYLEKPYPPPASLRTHPLLPKKIPCRSQDRHRRSFHSNAKCSSQARRLLRRRRSLRLFRNK